MAVGTIATVRAVLVANAFGERRRVEPAGQGAHEDWQRWSMFTLSTGGDADIPADLDLVNVPSGSKIQERRLVEPETFVRDEVANIVLPIENDARIAYRLMAFCAGSPARQCPRKPTAPGRDAAPHQR